MNKFSVIIPAYNEEKIINNTISYLKNFNDLEIIVVDGNPKGNTINKIQDKDVTKLVSVKGRGLQMNYGAVYATTNTLIFLHADTKLPKKAFSNIQNAINKGFQAGAFNLKFDSESLWIKFVGKTNKIRYKLTKTYYGDQAQFFTKKFFNELNGYPNIPLMEDVEMMKQIRKKALLNPPVLSSARRFHKEGSVYHPIRVGLILMLYYFGFSPKRLKKFYPD